MEFQNVLVVVLFASVWLVEGCMPNNLVNHCSGDELCQISSSNINGNRTTVRKYGTHYSIKLRGDPCSFNTYDDNRDGEIAERELHAVLGNNEVVDSLFSDMNNITDDAFIKPDEFHSKAPQIITEGFNSNS